MSKLQQDFWHPLFYFIHAETSEWNKTVYDPNVNMLRTQTETMSAVLGGVDSFTVHPFDDTFECHPSATSEG